ncbi:MAG: RDD family protein [Capsulimonadales bacterium]|nr:RDD family protein [Capsulimonadales bacterium]
MICTKCGTSNVNEADACRRCASPLHPAWMKGKIACYVHANREAVTACGVCGHRLCAACAVNVNGIDYCDACAPATAVRPSFDSDYERLPVLTAEKQVPATFTRRLRAWLVDIMSFVFLGALIAMFGWAFTGRIAWAYSPKVGGPAFFILWSLLLVVGTVYGAVVTSMTGQTFGKQLLGVIVLTKGGHIVDVRSSVLRALMAVVSALPLGLGFLWLLWDKQGETWHDKVAGTRVFQYEEIS